LSVKKTRQEKLRDKLEITEKELEDLLSTLPEYSNDCKCDRPLGKVKILHQEDTFNNLMTYCLSCGGFCENE
jgi:hypothetical protein